MSAMRRTAWLVLSLALAACGDNNGSTPIDAETPADTAVVPPDAEIIPDARVCEIPAAYPENVRVQSVDLQAPHSLTLSGTGTRCEQLVAALTDPTTRPPELAELDASGAVDSQCSFDDVTGRDIVRLRFPEYGGVPVFWPVQDVLAHVDASDDVVFLHGDFLPAGRAPATGCHDAASIGAEVPGEALGYTRFAACLPQGEGEYVVAADDEIEVGPEGVFHDADGNLRRVRAVDVYLLSDHVTAETTNSDLFCCTGENGTNHCIGKRLFLDVHTGEVVGDEPHCHTC